MNNWVILMDLVIVLVSGVDLDILEVVVVY